MDGKPYVSMWFCSSIWTTFVIFLVNIFNVWVFLNEETKIKFTYQLPCTERNAERTLRTSKEFQIWAWSYLVCYKKRTAVVKSLSFSTLAITISPSFMLHRRTDSSKYILNMNAYFASRISAAFPSPKTTLFWDETVSLVQEQYPRILSRYTYWCLLVNRLYNKLLVIERDVSDFAPGEPNLWG